MKCSTKTKHSPNGSNISPRLLLLGGFTMSTLLFTEWPHNAQAQNSTSSPPGTVILELYCRFGDGGYVGHDFDKGVIRGPYKNNTGRGTLRIYTAKDKGLIESASAQGRPMLEYSIVNDAGEILVWGGSQAYSDDISSDAEWISLGSVGGRFLRLNKVSQHFWKGGYTGISDVFVDELVVTFTALTCTKGAQ